MANRIRELRESFRWSQTELANRIGANKSQVSKLERGDTTLKPAWRDKIARAFGLRPVDIEDDSTGQALIARLVGAAGAGDQILPYGADFTAEPVPCPPGFRDPVAVVVRGESMVPAYLDGDVLLFERAIDVPATALRRDCVVEVHHGPVYVKRVLPGSKPGLYHLVSYNRSDVLTDQRLDWASPIRWIRRA